MLEPIRKSEWNPSLAAHLLNRAGFGAAPGTIAAFSALSPEDAVRRMVDYEPSADTLDPPSWVIEDSIDYQPYKKMKGLSEEEKQTLQREKNQERRRQLLQLRRWWLNRMRSTPNPLEEKLTLFWHGHFATSALKVRVTHALYAQNQTLRRHARGNWREMLVAVSQDPAMLMYLDNDRSRRGSPNENYARELMELFTLGEGNYTEMDIRESARAFTGWTIDRSRGVFEENLHMHDPGEKTFMGAAGPLDGYDIINEILKQPEGADYIASKMWRYFAYEDVEPELRRQLGQVFKKSGYEFTPLLETIFLSREFYSTKSLYSQIKSPVQWLVGTSILLDEELPDADACDRMLTSLGQELFAPPNVKGWNGGYAWITTASLIQRYNLSGLMVKGSGEMREKNQNRNKFKKRADQDIDMMGEDMMMAPMERMGPGLRRMQPHVEFKNILPEKNRGSLNSAWTHLEWRMYQRKLSESQIAAVMDYLSKQPEPSKWTDETLKNILHVMMSTPHYQVC